MTILRHALEDERHGPVADGGDPPPAGPYDWLVANLRANGLLREAEAVRLLVAAQASQPATAPVVPAGWVFTLNTDGSATVVTPGGGGCRIWERGGGGIEWLAYKMAAMLAAAPAAPVVQPMRFNRLPYEAITAIPLLADWSDTRERIDYAKRVDEAAVASCEIQLRQAAAAITAAATQAAQQGKAVALLRALRDALRSRHYGRMPDEVQRAYDAACECLAAEEPTHG